MVRHQLDCHFDEISSLMFLDADHLLSCSLDGTVRSWHVGRLAKGLIDSPIGPPESSPLTAQEEAELDELLLL